MYDDNRSFEHQIIPKKNIKQDEEDHRKKNKKNRRKEHVELQELPQREPQQQHQPRNSVTQTNKRNQEDTIFKDLCCIFSAYKPATIRKVLVENNYRKAEATNALCQLPPDNEEEEPFSHQMEGMRLAKERSEDNSSTNNSEVANNLMNEVYENLMKEEINGREFEELFEEIAQMIKEDQRDRGFGVLEINNFVDQCNSVKQTLLVGFREELSNFDECEFDQSYPLYAQTQQFIWETAQRRAKQEKQQQEDFPTLGSSSNGKSRSAQQQNIIDRIRLEEKKKKEEETYFFVPSKNVPQYAKERSNEASIFNVDNKLKSERDLMSLHKEFSNMPIRDLKFVYMTFVGDFNQSRQFLIRYYDSKRNARPQEQSSSNRSAQLPVRVHTSRLRKEEVDEEVKHLSLREIREEIDHLFKLRQALQITKMRIKSSTQKQELDRIINEKAPLIRKLAQASRVKEVEQMAKINPLYVDLHGYRQEEIDPLLDSITDMLRDQYQQRNEKVRTKKVKGRLAVCLTVMTGKGIHSKNNRSVLKPTTIDWCTSKGFDYEEEEDHLRLYITVG